MEGWSGRTRLTPGEKGEKGFLGCLDGGMGRGWEWEWEGMGRDGDEKGREGKGGVKVLIMVV